MTYLSGKGMWIWQLKQCEGGDISKIIAKAVDADLSHVIIKVADGRWPYNQVWNGSVWSDEPLANLISGLKSVGIDVWGWQYIYLEEPNEEGDIATRKINQFNLDGFVIDAEIEAKNKPTQTVKYLSRVNTTVPLALSSYRYPDYHPELPWNIWFTKMDLMMPQVYWIGASNSAQQLEQSYNQYLKWIKKYTSEPLVYIPTGSAWKTANWGVTPQQLVSFMDKAKELKMSASNFWSWQHASGTDLWTAVKNYNWSSLPTTDVPYPEWVVNYLYPWAVSMGYVGPKPTL